MIGAGILFLAAAFCFALSTRSEHYGWSFLAPLVAVVCAVAGTTLIAAGAIVSSS